MVRARVLAGGRRVAQGEAASPGNASTQPQKPVYSRAAACSLARVRQAIIQARKGRPLKAKRQPREFEVREYAGLCSCLLRPQGSRTPLWAKRCRPRVRGLVRLLRCIPRARGLALMGYTLSPASTRACAASEVRIPERPLLQYSPLFW